MLAEQNRMRKIDGQNPFQQRRIGFELVLGAKKACGDDDDVDLALRVVPDFLGRCADVDRRVGGVFELLRDDRVGNFLCQFLGAGDGAAHALGGGREFKARAEQQEISKRRAAAEAEARAIREMMNTPRKAVVARPMFPMLTALRPRNAPRIVAPKEIAVCSPC